MTPIPMYSPPRRAARRWTAVGAAVLAAAACSDFLSATNPAAIEEPNLNDPSMIPVMVNGVIGEFQPTYSTVAMYSAVLGDELRNAHVFQDNKPIDLRALTDANSLLPLVVYTPIHRARFMADTIAGRLRGFLGDTASRDPRLAEVLAYGGYSYVVMGENLCESPVNVSASFSSDELLAMAIPRFEEAIDIAEAAAAAGAPAATTDRIEYTARVGLGRAHLDLGNFAEAIAAVAGVPEDFEALIYHSDNSSREYNPYDNATGSNLNSKAATWLAVALPFQNLGDPRVPHSALTEVMDASMRYVPRQGLSFSGFDSTTAGATFEKTTSMRFASGLEARYIVAEAELATGVRSQTTVDLINERRKVGDVGASEVAITDAVADLQAALREERSRDFFLDGHRLGDLRRYIALYDVNLFPTGPYPGSTTGETYGESECWPIPQSEKNGNPNI